MLCKLTLHKLDRKGKLVSRDHGRDRGATKVELAVMLALVGVLASALLIVGGVRASADEAACEAVARSLVTASAAYLSITGAMTIDDADGRGGHQQTLVDAHLLVSVSELYDIDATGALVENGSGCRVRGT
jgi:hypothetical protein